MDNYCEILHLIICLFWRAMATPKDYEGFISIFLHHAMAIPKDCEGFISLFFTMSTPKDCEIPAMHVLK